MSFYKFFFQMIEACLQAGLGCRALKWFLIRDLYIQQHGVKCVPRKRNDDLRYLRLSADDWTTSTLHVLQFHHQSKKKQQQPSRKPNPTENDKTTTFIYVFAVILHREQCSVILSRAPHHETTTSGFYDFFS